MKLSRSKLRYVKFWIFFSLHPLPLYNTYTKSCTNEINLFPDFRYDSLPARRSQRSIVNARSFSNFYRNSLTHHETIYSCPKCSKNYKMKTMLERHLQLECNVQKMYKCTYCDYRTKHQVNVRAHMQHLHETPKDAQPTHVCPNCKKGYYYRHNLLKHIRLECGVEPKFQCQFCFQKFKQKGNLNEHKKRMHSDLLMKEY